MEKILVDTKMAGERLDKFLAKHFTKISRADIQKAIHKEQVLVNKIKSKPSVILKENDEIQISALEKPLAPPRPQDFDLKIMFENDDFLIVEKPAGMVIHPAHANTEGTLVNYLLAIRPEITKAIYDPKKQISLERPGIVHRLDKGTSGLVIIAKTKKSLAGLSKVIHDKKLKKIYLALTYGWPEKRGEIKNLLKRSNVDRRKISVANIGHEAHTKYEVLKYYKFQNYELSLVKAQPITGRTHQIRVHLSHLGYPVIGDNFYHSQQSLALSDKLGVKRQLLHAYNLEFKYKNRTFAFTSELPKDFESAMKKTKEVDG